MKSHQHIIYLRSSSETRINNYRNRFVTLTWIYGKRFQGPCPHCQPMTDWFWFEILVGTNLLPSTGFMMNFLVKWSAGGISKFITQSLFFVMLPSTGFKMNFLIKWYAGEISKFIMWSLFFVIRIFFQFVNS